MRTTIVIPTYNERENLRALIERIAALRIPECTVLIVDDASPDGTGALADELAQRFPVHVLHRACKAGLGSAYVAGFEHALANGAEMSMQMDADGSHDPAEIPSMIAAITDGADLVIGSRRVPGGTTVGWGLHRRSMSRGAQALARHLLNLRTRDVTSGFRAWRAETLMGILARGTGGGVSVPGALTTERAWPEVRWPSDRGSEGGGSGKRAHGASERSRDGYPPSARRSAQPHVASGYAFQEEMLFCAERAGARIVEHPITFRDREHGRSKLGLRDVLGYFTTLARLWWRMDDHRFTVLLGFALVVITATPYLYAWLRTPPGYVWTGVHALASGDTAVYASYLEQIREGRWLFVDLFTSEWPQQPFLNIFWLAAGLIGRALHLSANLAFHGIRLALIVPFTLFLARFIATFLRTPIDIRERVALDAQASASGWRWTRGPRSREDASRTSEGGQRQALRATGARPLFSLRTIRRTALVLLACSSGLGPLVAEGLMPASAARWRPGYDYWPIDLWVPESNTFLTLYQSPHFILSLWLLLAIILYTLRASAMPSTTTRGRALVPGSVDDRAATAADGDRPSEGGGSSEDASAGHPSDPGSRCPTGAWSTTRHRQTLLAGCAALALFQFHPFYVPTVFALLAAWTLVESFAARRIRWDLVRHSVIVAVISASSIAYHLWLVHRDPVTAWRAAQNILLTPDWWLVAIGYGALVPLAGVGIIALSRIGRSTRGRALVPGSVDDRAATAADGDRPSEGGGSSEDASAGHPSDPGSRRPTGAWSSSAPSRLLLTWLAVTVVLIFSPLPWQRRLTEGLHVVLVLLATIGLFPLLVWIRPRLPALLRRYAWNTGTAVAIAVPLLGLTTFIHLIRDVALATIRFPASIPRYSLYYPREAVDAMRWIRDRTADGKATLALGIDGNFLPMFAARQTVVGHGVETTDFVTKYRTAHALARGELSPDAATAFLARERVRFILITDASRDLWSLDPATLPHTRTVFANARASVIERTRP